ncbi:hypothetical protein [Nonomuraea sp. NPDC050786]|uniref:hypothetical protein n=1 Tax=Nonomuraea sp. NPDC050786 TaxID=3154840 RepID=UPI0033E3C6FD
MSRLKTPTSTPDKAMWLLGALFTIQGFGSAITESQWGTSFGIAGILRAAGFPNWADLVIGAVGAVFLLVALYRTVRR